MANRSPRSSVPYLYANRRWPVVERMLTEVQDRAVFPDPGLAVDEVEWTSRIGPRTYAYFPAAGTEVTGTECAGLYLPQALGIPVPTAELPMFDWTAFTDPERIAARETMERWIEDGCGPRTELLAGTVRLLARATVSMTPAPANARVLDAVLRGVRLELQREVQRGIRRELWETGRPYSASDSASAPSTSSTSSREMPSR